ncbi:MAG: hypothetical protein K2Q09_00700 [Phycisphaerales bacterium]|nr:hypothetical protein [Phycisphaerales bacterium]
MNFADAEDRLPLLGVFASTAAFAVIGYRVVARHLRLQRWMPSQPGKDVRLDGDAARAVLARQGVACAGCSYDLRGTDGQRCPECGTTIHLYARARLSGGVPARGLWASLVASCAGTGAVAVSLGTEVWRMYAAQGWWYMRRGFAVHVAAFAISALACAVLGYRMVRWPIDRRERPDRWAEGTLAALLMLGGIWTLTMALAVWII